MIPDFNIWHRIPEPKEFVKKEKWKKYGKYEVKVSLFTDRKNVGVRLDVNKSDVP